MVITYTFYIYDAKKSINLKGVCNMKGTFIMSIVVVFSMLVIPLSALSQAQTNAVPTVAPTVDAPYEENKKSYAVQTFKVLKDGNILELSAGDYVFGVVAAEMPALYHEEALKAQAIAAYTFACYRKNSSSGSEYDITADGDTAQCFITRDEAKSRWGEKADEYAKKIDACIAAVTGELLSFDNQPIFAAYHAISPGKTNPCIDVWGKDIPYLKSADSSGDTGAEGYQSEVTFSIAELTEKLKSICEPSGEAKNYFSEFSVGDTGYVKQLKYCGKVVAGSQVTKLLGLRSSNFTVAFTDSKFIFSVKGYGHGVGMSQTGANFMASQGKTYKEILLHYYSGATLQKN